LTKEESPEWEPYRSILRTLRATRRLTQQTMADRCYISPPYYGNIERGERLPNDQFTTGLLKAFPELTEVITDAVQQARGKASVYPDWFKSWIDAEQRASVLRWWEHSQLPGLLQTEAYARAVLSEDAQVAGRIERQQVLDRGITLIALVDEYALHRPVGGPKAMREQLEHLIDVSERPNVYLHVLPAETVVAPGLLGAFVLATFDDGMSGVAYLESAGDEAQITALSATVARLELIFETLRSETLPRGASRDRIQKVMNERWTDQ
jgi:transcriptional regulator with XRE-family HTH domain